MKKILYLCLIVLSKHAMCSDQNQKDTNEHASLSNFFEKICNAEYLIDQSGSVILKSHKTESHNKFIRPVRSSGSGFTKEDYDAHQKYLEALTSGLKEHPTDTAA